MELFLNKGMNWEVLLNMVSPVSIATGVQYYRLRKKQNGNVLMTDSETWFHNVYSIAGLVCRDKSTRLITNPKQMGTILQVCDTIYCWVCSQVLDFHAGVGTIFATCQWLPNGERAFDVKGFKPVGKGKSAKDLHEAFDSVLFSNETKKLYCDKCF